MNNDLAVICSIQNVKSSWLYITFQISPITSFPVYLTAILLILKSKSKLVLAVKKLFLRQIVINYIFLILISVIVCPILEPPVPGYYMTGLLATFEMNVALPLVLMTHVVLLVAISIMQLLKHQLITISDIRFTQKFEKPVKILIKFYKLCTILMLIVAISILPALTIQLDFYNFRQSAYEYFKNPMVLCDDMFIADHRHWKIYVPYFCSLIFGAWCSITGVTSVFTCLLMIYESRNIVSKETLNMQRNFTGILIYQALVYIIFIIVPVAVISTLFYADIHITDYGLPYLLMICSQGTINNMIHIVPGIRKILCKKGQQSATGQKDIALRSVSASVLVT
ncbi:Serpentine Receptor, class H [Caenorhabditis elegans]|uniref:Serpentine Receptor, class H n=1 Tax=Caenorhabditis elegans TaxID=6239 RepID=A4UVM0_CAEEL|nr:Serpentine Receptor, class H [Caenorhabditis elegans]CAM84813.1 Serpentine Receptor, class H [Caenorhabditis elegans]|eukprot:NP_001122996.1 Uncharacterized protein CELE_T03E6.9 [Caenorhabditis elegans]